MLDTFVSISESESETFPWRGCEATAPKHHWSEWYAAYIVARERGRTPDDAAANTAGDVERRRAALRASRVVEERSNSAILAPSDAAIKHSRMPNHFRAT